MVVPLREWRARLRQRLRQAQRRSGRRSWWRAGTLGGARGWSVCGTAWERGHASCSAAGRATTLPTRRSARESAATGPGETGRGSSSATWASRRRRRWWWWTTTARCAGSGSGLRGSEWECCVPLSPGTARVFHSALALHALWLRRVLFQSARARQVQARQISTEEPGRRPSSACL